MLVTINPSDGLPIYRQIVRQVRHAVASGILSPGDKLPSQRDLSSELVINHLTVKKAYEVLEAQGIITTERGRGTFVAESVPGDLKKGALRDMQTRARELADMARLLDLDFDEYRQVTEDGWTESQENKGDET